MKHMSSWDWLRGTCTIIALQLSAEEFTFVYTMHMRDDKQSTNNGTNIRLMLCKIMPNAHY